MTMLMLPKPRSAPYLQPKRKRPFNWRAGIALFVNFIAWAGVIYAALNVCRVLADALSR